MGIISEIGRKNFKVRLLIWFISVALILGAITMVYPFALMISGSSKSGVDVSENRLIPSFLRDSKIMYQKTVEAIFNEKSDVFQSAYDVQNGDFKQLEPPDDKSVNRRLVKEWNQFITKRNYPHYYYGLSFIYTPTSYNTSPINLRRFKAMLSKRFHNNLEDMNNAMQLELVSWNVLFVEAAEYLNPRIMPNVNTELYNTYYAFKAKLFDGSQDSLPLVNRYFFNPEGYFKTIYLRAQYTQKIGNYNAVHKTHYASWDKVKLTRFYPADKKQYTDLQRKDWNEFVRALLNRFWIRVNPAARSDYHAYLEARYNNQITLLNKFYNSNYKRFSEIELVTQLREFPFFGSRLSDWDSYILGWTDSDDGKFYQVPGKYLEVTGALYDFRDYLKNKYKTVAAANKLLKTDLKDWSDVKSQQQAAHYLWIKKNSAALKWEFLVRNFISVFDYIVLRGYAIWNTFVYCGCAILCALIVNPLAAYALSRFNPPSTYKILLFLMVTMAFPPMVTQIPVFLLMREFNLLNTYGALILPGLANGYMVFLLKGFFDSLPKELYESAAIDGASECRIFLQITMSLSTPILAVIALQTFQFAYSNFMMALLYCQDENMWTIMPWLYQLQTNSCQGVIFASLIIAALPTFLVFAFCQNIIMRGIVVPVEK
ncbi:MAG: carbohydrate ABC transporter permease [Victivallaceae bacterium]|nr:carbohydrate ABC transporter permease [Victivallaceae bacterium]